MFPGIRRFGAVLPLIAAISIFAHFHTKGMRSMRFDRRAFSASTLHTR